MMHSAKRASRAQTFDIPGWTGTDEKAASHTLSDVYALWTDATVEERALVGVFGLALILLLIIVGMALSQYVVCFVSCTINSTLL
jgi:hypothetical protein